MEQRKILIILMILSAFTPLNLMQMGISVAQPNLTRVF